MNKEEIEEDEDTATIVENAEKIENPQPRQKRKAAVISQRKTREMSNFLRRLCASEARYAWVYVPGMEDEQYDVVCVPLSDMDNFNLEQLFAYSSDSDSSMELDEGEPDPDIHDNDTRPDSTQTQPPPPDTPQTSRPLDQEVFNSEGAHTIAQSRVKHRPGPFQPKSRSSSTSSVQTSKRAATSPKASEPTKVPRVSKESNLPQRAPSRKSDRSKSEVDYYRVQHRYDDIIH